MTSNLAELGREYHALNQLWQADHQDDPDGITQRQLELAEQMATIEARDFGEIAMQAKVLADMLGIEPVDPERALAVAIAKRLEALAAPAPPTAG